MKWKHLALLVLLSAIWGGSYLFIRITGPTLGPFVLMAARVILAAAGLWLYCLAVGTRPDLRRHWRQFMVLGALNNAIPFTLIAAAVISLNASVAAILNATTPLFAALVGTVWLKEPLGARRAAGVLLGILGVGVLMGWSPLPRSPGSVIAAGAALLAALSYGLAANYARVRMQGVPPLHTAAGQLAGASLLLAPFALGSLPAAAPGPEIIAVVVVLALLCTSFAYLIYFRLIAEAGATQAATVTFLVPFFSVMWGAVFLREPLNAGMFAGLAIILISVWLVLAPTGRGGIVAAEKAPQHVGH